MKKQTGEQQEDTQTSSSDSEELSEENLISWESVTLALEDENLIICELKHDIAEHIVAALLYWQRMTEKEWKCIQVVKLETVSEEKRCLLLELQHGEKEFSLKYFITHELVDQFYVEDFELTRQSKADLKKFKFIGAKIGRK